VAIRELVESIQATFPPSDQIPPPLSGDPIAGSPEDGLPPVERHAVPDWLDPGKGIPFRGGDVLNLEGAGVAVMRRTPPEIDVLAYYLPFHFYSKDWGIYLSAGGLLSVVTLLGTDSEHCQSQELLGLARDLLIQHERFHFFAEAACARAELVSGGGRAFYKGYFRDRGATAIEEALANAHALRTSARRQSLAVRKKIEEWFEGQGPGYRDFGRCLEPKDFTGYCRIAVQKMRSADRTLSLSANGIGVGGGGLRISLTQQGGRCVTRSGNTKTIPTEFLFAGLARSTVPTYVVLDVAGVGLLRPFPKYAGVRVRVHTNDHPPPHIHVEIPPGRDFGRLEWPTLEPLTGDTTLSNEQMKSLQTYLAKFRGKIDEKVSRVYRSTAQDRAQSNGTA
jgi:hypothetical protein